VLITRKSLVVIVAVLLSLSSVANAKGSKDAARAAFKSATQHFNLGEYAEALDAFKEAYRNFEDPVFLFNIAQCHRMMGNKQEAVRGYRTFLREAPDAPNRVEVEQLIASLDAAIREDAIAKNRTPTGTIVPRDDARPSRTGTEPPPPEPLPSAGGTAPATGTTQPADNNGAQLTATNTPPSRSSDKPIYKKWWLWTIVGGVAVVGLGVGLGVGLSSGSVSYPSATTTAGTVKF